MYFRQAARGEHPPVSRHVAPPADDTLPYFELGLFTSMLNDTTDDSVVSETCTIIILVNWSLLQQQSCTNHIGIGEGCVI